MSLMRMGKLMMFDFTCTVCGLTKELLVAGDVHITMCDAGHEMKRVISGTSFVLDGTDPAFPTAYAGWEKKRLSKQDS